MTYKTNNEKQYTNHIHVTFMLDYIVYSNIINIYININDVRI